MATADGYVLPKPGTPKTIGILNTVFGVLMVLYGICMSGYMLAVPYMVKFAEKTVKDVQEKVEAQNKAQLKTFDDREKAATTEEEKAAIRQERDATIAGTPKVEVMDMSAATDTLKDPMVMGYTYGYLLTGLLLSVFLLISGIGLIRLRPWGGSLAKGWAVAQILQIVLFAVLSIVFVQPVARQGQEKMMAQAEATAKKGNAGPGAAETIQMAKVMSSSGVAIAMTAAISVIGMIYPVVVLILIGKPSSRAALQGPKPAGPGEF